MASSRKSRIETYLVGGLLLVFALGAGSAHAASRVEMDSRIDAWKDAYKDSQRDWRLVYERP